MAISELANLPISAIVDRPRPFVDHPELEVLVEGKEGTLSFVSDHSAMSMGIAVALLLVNRRLGLVAGALALLQGFCRMYMGVHYPTDVIGGFALATAVVLLLAPLAMAVLVPFCHALTRTAAAPLVVARKPARGGAGDGRSRRRREPAAVEQPLRSPTWRPEPRSGAPAGGQAGGQAVPSRRCSSASRRARSRERRPGANQPQLQLAKQNDPRSWRATRWAGAGPARTPPGRRWTRASP
ncbi:phosphatase PAP2 family protein [Kitasatospora arboriphila]